VGSSSCCEGPCIFFESLTGTASVNESGRVQAPQTPHPRCAAQHATLWCGRPHDFPELPVLFPAPFHWVMGRGRVLGLVTRTAGSRPIAGDHSASQAESRFAVSWCAFLCGYRTCAGTCAGKRTNAHETRARTRTHTHTQARIANTPRTHALANAGATAPQNE
jgi:hypothetical protein